MTKKLTLCVLLLALAGCSSTVPDSIQAKASTHLIGFEQVVQANDVHINEKAQWGGMIVDVVQLENHTVLEVANLALSSNAKPMAKKPFTGHFKIYIDGKVDPKDYRQGKLVTALGEIGPAERGKIGIFPYHFPTLSNAAVYVWQQNSNQSLHKGETIPLHMERYLKRFDYRLDNQNSKNSKTDEG